MKTPIFILVVISLFLLTVYLETSNSPDTKHPLNQSYGKSTFVEVKTNKSFNPNSNLDHDLRWFLLNKNPILKDNFNGFGKAYNQDSVNILCFRGNNYRNKASVGEISGKPNSLKLDWVFRTRRDSHKTRFGTWGGGTGWTGQPLIIRWNKEMKINLDITDQNFIENDEALEVVIGSLCGEIYFLNFETGDSTRSSLKIDGPIKGTPSVDPRLNGLLYVGQGIGLGNRFGSYIFDMVKRKVVFYQPGKDVDSDRKWGAFDSNPLIDATTGNVFWPAENGIIYTFNSQTNQIPTVTHKLKYRKPKMKRYGLESSMAAFGKYGFFADNSGNILCIDLIKQTPIWNQNNYDDTDASIVLDKEGVEHFLYVGNEVDFRAPEAASSFRKLRADNGNEVWKIEQNCFGTPIYNKTNSGGILATPLIGKKKLDALVYCIFSRIDKKNRALLVAVNKKSGKEQFSFTLDAYSWASPVDFYDKEGNGYLFFTDVRGGIYLLDGKTGKLIYKEKTKYTFESSPVIINDRIVVGVRGNKILSFKIII